MATMESPSSSWHEGWVTHMDWLVIDENISTFIAVSGTCLFAMAGILLGR
jgi:hypothetical protein